jgi:hypothetical protein
MNFELMKYQTLFILLFGIIGMLSLTIQNSPIKTASAWDCSWEVQWDELVPVCEPERDLLIKLVPDIGLKEGNNNDQILLDRQSSLPVNNLLINTDNLNTTQTIKITNLGNGTTLINVVNATS